MANYIIHRLMNWHVADPNCKRIQIKFNKLEHYDSNDQILLFDSSTPPLGYYHFRGFRKATSARYLSTKCYISANHTQLAWTRSLTGHAFATGLKRDRMSALRRDRAVCRWRRINEISEISNRSRSWQNHARLYDVYRLRTQDNTRLKVSSDNMHIHIHIPWVLYRKQSDIHLRRTEWKRFKCKCWIHVPGPRNAFSRFATRVHHPLYVPALFRAFCGLHRPVWFSQSFHGASRCLFSSYQFASLRVPATGAGGKVWSNGARGKCASRAESLDAMKGMADILKLRIRKLRVIAARPKLLLR